PVLLVLLFRRPAPHRHLHSFPTRRSSDLLIAIGARLLLAVWNITPGAPTRRYKRRPRKENAREHGIHIRHAVHHALQAHVAHPGDRKSTRLNSSHVKISYAVFCLKKKKWT